MWPVSLPDRMKLESGVKLASITVLSFWYSDISQIYNPPMDIYLFPIEGVNNKYVVVLRCSKYLFAAGTKFNDLQLWALIFPLIEATLL